MTGVAVQTQAVRHVSCNFQSHTTCGTASEMCQRPIYYDQARDVHLLSKGLGSLSTYSPRLTARAYVHKAGSTSVSFQLLRRADPSQTGITILRLLDIDMLTKPSAGD